MHRSSVTGAPPDAYERHVGRYGRELAAGMIGAARVRRGQRALDVGCGPGALTVGLAALLGADNVAAIDPSERFVDVCRARVPGADVRVAVAESLPFPDSAFDAVLAQLVVDGMDDAPQGVAEMRRVAQPGGIVAACVWDFDEGMPLLRTAWDAALAFDASAARSFGADKRLPFSRPNELVELWKTTGFASVELCQLLAGADYADLDDLWSPFADGVGGLGRFVQSLAESHRVALKQDIGRRLGSPDGSFRLTARAWCVRGAVPHVNPRRIARA
jgi:ubiquinone/menaquinone biosynthesis C-methylase UbiE